MSNVYVQCSQETAVLDAQQLGDLRVMAGDFTSREFSRREAGIEADSDTLLAEIDRTRRRRPLRPNGSDQRLHEPRSDVPGLDALCASAEDVGTESTRIPARCGTGCSR
ncbi:MAG: hypothetical protein R2748_21310 [Bryobacterales bacterium]